MLGPAELRIHHRTGVVPPLAVKLGGHPTKVLITEPGKRWGRASKYGVVRLNWRIVQAVPSFIEYFIAHELVHLVHRDHGPAFWSKLRSVMADYDERKESFVVSARRWSGIRRPTALRPRAGAHVRLRSRLPQRGLQNLLRLRRARLAF